MPMSISLGRKSIDQLKGTLGGDLSFFDNDAIMKAVDKGLRKQLGWFGGYVRRAARNSLKTQVGASRPGSPPFSHTGVLKNFIFYTYDSKTQTVIIGPAATTQKNARSYGNYKTIPETLEYGGMLRVREHQLRSGKWIRTDMRFRLNGGDYRSAIGKLQRQRLLNIEARPFMQPVFKRSLIQFRKRLVNFVKK